MNYPDDTSSYHFNQIDSVAVSDETVETVSQVITDMMMTYATSANMYGKSVTRPC